LIRAIRTISEPEGFHDAVTGIELSVFFRKRQQGESRVEQYACPSWALDFGLAAAPTRTRGVVQNGWASLCLAIGPGSAIWNGQQAPPGTLSLLPPGEALDGSTVEGFHWLTAAIPPELWRRCVMLAGVEDAAPQQLTVCQLPEGVFDSVRHQLIEIRTLLGRCPFRPPGACPLVERVERLVISLFTTACELAKGVAFQAGPLRNRARLTGLAEEHMLAALGEPLCVPELCAALRVSRRELEYAFRSVFDQSPRDYLETLRLHAIRRELLRAGGKHLKVTEIAYAHGIQHLGRFAARYRERFGEPPSETLVRGGRCRPH
jgi:AraC-like DNA-binding protein